MERSSRKHRDSDRTSKHADDHHRSKHRETDGDDRRRRSERERSEEIENRVKREKSYDRETSKERESREKSVDNRRHHKRKDRGDSEDEDRYYDVRDKRVRVSDERKERRRFEVKVAAAEDERDREERKERRRFEDSVKKEEVEVGDLRKRSVKVEDEDESVGVSGANGGAPRLRNKALGTPHETPSVPEHHIPKVPGKSSTDGNSLDAGKSGGISLDALSKAKATLLKRKELAEKMKKNPLNKSVDSKDSMKVPATSQPLSTSAHTLLSGSTASTQPLVSGVPQLAGLSAPKFEAVKRAQELAAKMGI
ncbi:hypothetical protein HanIR_Chr15g0760881 [Helianthus annuus]|nr:hypothetical protein HanIR_Chr15g0760881 [Helianthus annuus]